MHPRPMNRAEIAAAVRQVSAAVTDGVVVKIREPLPDHLAFEVRKSGRNVEFVIGVAAGLSRIHLADNLPPTPPGPCALTLRARKLMRPSRVVGIEQLAGDRLVVLTVSRHTEAKEQWQGSLVAELFSRGRLFLLDDRQRVLAVSGPGGTRGLAVGDVYQPPAPPTVAAPAETAEKVTCAQLEARYAEWAGRQQTERAVHAEAARIGREKKRITRKIAAMERDLARLDGWEELAREGELLAAHRHLLKRGMSQVSVTDWHVEGSPECTIVLDPERTPEQHIEDLFKKARKARSGRPQITARIAAAHADLERLAKQEVMLAEAPEKVPLARQKSAPKAGRRSDKSGGNLRRFVSSDKWDIYVGRSATENDRITFRLARGNDLWFHARDTPGSHVLLRGSGTAPERAVHEAAALAAHFSKLKNQGGGEVICAQRKYLKKPRGGHPGQVLVTQERVIHVRLDEELVARLKRRRAD